MCINIAIDGPSAAGKSTLAKRLAKRLGYIHLDTGAMYRCVALEAIKQHVNVKDEDALVDMIKKTKIALVPDGRIYINDEDVSDKIRTQDISMLASDVSAFAQVRIELVQRQQEMAQSKGVIMDGRDIGTVVLPNAEVKIFLTATPEARAERRYKENREKGMDCDYDTIKQDIIARDWQDSHREHSPLCKAEDAVEIDSSYMTIDEVTEKLLCLIK